MPIPLPTLRHTLTPPPVHPGRTQTLRVTDLVLRRKSQPLGFHPLLEGNTPTGSSSSSPYCSSPSVSWPSMRVTFSPPQASSTGQVVTLP